MRRAVHILLLIGTFAVLLSPAASAGEWDEYGQQFDTSRVEQAVPDSASELMEDVKLDPTEDFSGELEKIVRRAVGTIGATAKSAMKSLVTGNFSCSYAL